MSASNQPNQSYSGSLGVSDLSNDFAAMRFVIRALIGEINTATLVKVITCTNEGGVAAIGTVDVQPLVNQVDGDNLGLPRLPIYRLPYMRVQGGVNAVIMDPHPGDIGMAVFASHDISTVKSTKDQSNPGSRRRFSMSDGLYVGGFLNGTPEQYIQFTDSGITLKSPVSVNIDAPEATINAPSGITIHGPITQDGGDATFSGSVAVAGQITASSGKIGGSGAQSVKLADGTSATKLQAR